MPNRPQPYEMRDWKAVAHGYDAFVFDFDRTGQYLPLGWFVDDAINYPGQRSFGLATVVGTPPGRERFAEAINVLPALVGASLVGVDKSNQQDVDWVQMAAEFFNRRPAENVYLNTPASRSGNDWWYETMPNVFFYQLYSLYPDTDHFEEQFTTVADRWLQAVQAMGASTTPWTVPDMHHRAFDLATMTPNDEGVPEPEAAGAIAWILYQAYVETSEERYRIGAEQAMDFLSDLRQNPAYELQLPYGVLAAARMNAELGTSYDVEQLMNWCFQVGPLRSWGVISDTWGDYDVHGLVGEVSANSYAFLMNGFQHAAALLPVARYDPRYARALGKWALHVANNSRLFYPKYLPPEYQDSDAWAFEHDPESYIGHEALRETHFGRSPYGTGDAIDGDWGYTNLALYGSSHVGYLAALVDTTDVPMVLRLDTRATDWFGADAYASYLYYNPHEEEQTVTVELGDGTYDLYDAVTQSFVARGVQRSTPVALPADAARLLVLTPAGAATSYDGSHMVVDGVVVDYRARPGVERPPRIRSLAAVHDTLSRGETVPIHCTAENKDGGAVTYDWSASGGTLDSSGAQAMWTAPQQSGRYVITCTVQDAREEQAEATILIDVVNNRAPEVSSVRAQPNIVDAGGSTTLTCEAKDADGDTLSYDWSATTGTFAGEGPDVVWTAPDVPGYHVVTCRVQDSAGAGAEGKAGVVVGHLVLHLPLDDEGDDASGFGNDGIVQGATRVAGPEGMLGRAYTFDGQDDHIRVASHPSLNFREAITVSYWMKAVRLHDREAFLVSHGSWQNRWKLSLTPDHTLRWTLRTGRGVVDLDAPEVIGEEAWYFVAASYDGERLRLYVDGELVGAAAWSGLLSTTTYDLTLAQMLPGEAQWNFEGVLDDVRVYNQALTPDDVAALFAEGTDVKLEEEGRGGTMLYSPYPNPFEHSATFAFEVERPTPTTLEVFDLLGRRVRVLYDAPTLAGSYQVPWNGRDAEGRRVAAGLYVVRLQAGSVVDQRSIVVVNDDSHR